jgi:glycosyltransferase involved in cell wall biosynthesis
LKKLLIMASLFWPQKNSGGPPISIMNLVQSIKDQFDIYIISKNHEINDDKPLEGIVFGWNQFEFGKAYYTKKDEHTFKNITRLIEDVEPDVIYQNSFFSIDDLLPVLVYKKKHKNVKVIVAPRGEFYPERLQVGKLKKTVYGKLFRYSGLLKDVYFQGTGQEECMQEKVFLGISDNYLMNIQNISLPVKGLHGSIEKKPNELKLVYIARIHPTKNTLKAIEWLGGLSGNIQYDIYGSIENEIYWKQCQDAISRLPQNITVRYKGVIDHEQVASTIAGYHAYYMPTTGENFGHSIVEAMLMGKPVVISDQTPWTDVNGNGGFAISLNDETAFITALDKLTEMNIDKYSVLSEQIENYIKGKLDVDNIIHQYIAAFDGE